MKTHILTGLERELLLGAFSDLMTLKRGRPIPGCSRTDGFFALREAVAHAKEQDVVRVDTARWLGEHPETAADRMAVSRAFVRLEDKGFIERIVPYVRITHVYLTPSGRKLARELTSAKKRTKYV